MTEPHKSRALSLPTLSPVRLDEILRDATPEFLVELAALFVRDVERRLKNIETSVKNRDPRQTALGAHTVQGAAASLGVLRMRSLAEALEADAARLDWPAVDASLDKLLAEFGYVRRMLQTSDIVLAAPRVPSDIVILNEEAKLGS
jgi:HPt (histidine-containing phosphotransfer) domain-containing protein